MELFLNTTDIYWEELEFVWSEEWILNEVDGIIRAGRSRRRKKPPAYSYTGKTHKEEVEEYEDVEEIYDELGDEEKVRKLIRMVCVVRGMKYDERREMREVKITVDDIKQTIVEVNKKIHVTVI